MPRKKIAIIHPQLNVGGGSEACALWIAEALKQEYNVSLIASGEINLGRLNEFYGTNLSENEIDAIEIPISRLFKNKFDALRTYKLARFCKKIAPKFDVMISTYNFLMDFGKPGVQLIADLSFDDELRRTYDIEPGKPRKWLYKKSFMRECYLKLAEILAGASRDDWKKNIIISNSLWTQKIIKDFYGVESDVIYPPAVGKFLDVPWASRENGFLYLGRISPEKQIEKIIEILAEVRKNNFDVHLHIVGGAKDPIYEKLIKDLCEKNKTWCFMEGIMHGQEKLDFIAKHRFGISARSNEPFGIAVAEMVKVGCIVFVPDGGGQTEIVGQSSLIYKDAPDAIEKIEIIINNKELQDDLRQNLSKNSQKFSVQNFKREINVIINEFLKKYEKR